MAALDEIKEALLRYDKVACTRLTEQGLSAEVDPLEIMAIMTEAMREVGDGFGRGDLFLPDLVGVWK